MKLVAVIVVLYTKLVEALRNVSNVRRPVMLGAAYVVALAVVVLSQGQL